MAKLVRLKINCEPPVKLDEGGYAELVSHIQERMAEDGEGDAYQVTAMMLEVEPAEGEPQPLTGEADARDPASNGDEEGGD